MVGEIYSEVNFWPRENGKAKTTAKKEAEESQREHIKEIYWGQYEQSSQRIK